MPIPIAGSFHLSSKDNGIKTKSDLSHALQHNLRQYKKDLEYLKNDIDVIYGKEDCKLNDVREMYDEIFGNAVYEYNLKQNRASRKINSYFDYISDKNKTTDMACEIIFGYGDARYWAGTEIGNDAEKRARITDMFREDLDKFQELFPTVEIVSAVVHYNEKGQLPLPKC